MQILRVIEIRMKKTRMIGGGIQWISQNFTQKSYTNLKIKITPYLLLLLFPSFQARSSRYFYLILYNCKWPRLSRILPSILAAISSVVVWTLSIILFISISHDHFSRIIRVFLRSTIIGLTIKFNSFLFFFFSFKAKFCIAILFFFGFSHFSSSPCCSIFADHSAFSTGMNCKYEVFSCDTKLDSFR